MNLGFASLCQVSILLKVTLPIAHKFSVPFSSFVINNLCQISRLSNCSNLLMYLGSRVSSTLDNALQYQLRSINFCSNIWPFSRLDIIISLPSFAHNSVKFIP